MPPGCLSQPIKRATIAADSSSERSTFQEYSPSMMLGLNTSVIIAAMIPARLAGGMTLGMVCG